MYREKISVEEAGLVKVEVLVDFFFLIILGSCGCYVLLNSWLLEGVTKKVIINLVLISLDSIMSCLL